MAPVPKIPHKSKLTEAIIVRRTSRFTIDVNISGNITKCHCPSTGRIGNIDLANVPCLLSQSDNPDRKTKYTIEAISLNRPSDTHKSWIGINQNAINRYVEYYLSNGYFDRMIGSGTDIRREVVLGDSKLDFLANNNIYLEVKTPLQYLQVDLPSYIKTHDTAPFTSTDRLVRHVTQLANSLKQNERAIMLICFMYDNPGFQVVEKHRSMNYEEVKCAIDKARAMGVENWQANFKITEDYVELTGYWELGDVE